MTPSPDLPEQGDPADKRLQRQWTISHDCSAEDDVPQAFRVTGPEICYGSVEVAPLERALRAEEALRRLLKEAEIMNAQLHDNFCVPGERHDCEPEALKFARRALARHPGFLPTPTEKERG